MPGHLENGLPKVHEDLRLADVFGPHVVLAGPPFRTATVEQDVEHRLGAPHLTPRQVLRERAERSAGRIDCFLRNLRVVRPRPGDGVPFDRPEPLRKRIKSYALVGTEIKHKINVS